MADGPSGVVQDTRSAFEAYEPRLLTPSGNSERGRYTSRAKAGGGRWTLDKRQAQLFRIRATMLDETNSSFEQLSSKRCRFCAGVFACGLGLCDTVTLTLDFINNTMISAFQACGCDHKRC
eukprot:scaffold3540_cov147-Isochrysis_galbana.AAC.3